MAVFNTSTADGRNRCSNATYTTARSGGGTFATDTTATFTEVGQELFGGVYYCYEAYWSFDTSSIPSGATILSATLEAYVVSYTSSSSTAAVVRARVYDWGTTVTSGDWVAGASVSGQTLVAHLPALSGLTTSAYNTFTDDALAANIVKAGTTKFILTTDRFEAGTVPTGAPNGGEYASLETAEGSNPPKLTVTWATDTDADAENIAATGASYTAGPTVNVTAIIASAVASVSTGQGSDLELAATGGQATATGTAYQPGRASAPSIEAATATGAANDATVTTVAVTDADAEAATATGAASDATATVAPNGGAGTATGAASDPSFTTAPTIGAAAATGSAYDATPSTTSAVNADAGHASATGAALDITATVAAPAGHASATVAAADAGKTNAASIGHASASGAAHDATTLRVVAVNAGLAEATGSAYQVARLDLSPANGYGEGTGTAYPATVTTTESGRNTRELRVTARRLAPSATASAPRPR